MPQKVTVPTEINKGDLHSLHYESLQLLLLVPLHPSCGHVRIFENSHLEGSYVGDSMGNKGADVAGKKRSWKRRKEEPWLLF